MHVCGKLIGYTDLIARVKSICFKHDVSFLKVLVDKHYADKTRTDLKKRYMLEDGLADSVRQLLLSRDPYDRYVINILLMPF